MDGCFCRQKESLAGAPDNQRSLAVQPFHITVSQVRSLYTFRGTAVDSGEPLGSALKCRETCIVSLAKGRLKRGRFATLPTPKKEEVKILAVFLSRRFYVYIATFIPGTNYSTILYYTPLTLVLLLYYPVP